MTWQILMFSFSVLPNYGWDFCQPEKCTDIIAGELHCGKGERWLSGLPGQGYPASPCQTGSPQPLGSTRGPVWVKGEREALGLGQGSPPRHHKLTWILGEMALFPSEGTSSRRKTAKQEFLIHTYLWGTYIFHPLLGELQTPAPRHGLDHRAPT